MAACTTKKDADEPKISLKINVSDLTEEDFKSVGTYGLENPIDNGENQEKILNLGDVIEFR